MNRLSLLIHQCHLILPLLNLQCLLSLGNVGELEAAVDQQFSPLFPAPADSFFLNVEAHIKILQDLAGKLTSAAMLYPKFASFIRLHEYVPSNGLALAAFANVQLLLECTNTKRLSLEQALWKGYDNYPDKTERKLRLIMDNVWREGDPTSGKVPNMNISHFQTLETGRWVNDKIVNYFMTKWCTQSGTMGLSTFFANGHLFQPSESEPCVHATVGTLTAENERKVLRWCKQMMKSQNLVANWDSVFIPINERSTHWFSTYIDFRCRQIEIYDSLEINCVNNRRKPITHQKNTQLMLIKQGADVMPGLAFSDNMIGKRLRLAGELLRDYSHDTKHRKYQALQTKNISSRFARTAEAALTAANEPSRVSFGVPPSDTASSENTIGAMNIDDEETIGYDTDDTDGDIVDVTMGGPLDEEERRHNKAFDMALDQAADILLAAEDNGDTFDFLPDPVLPPPNSSNPPAPTPVIWSLFEEDTEFRTWRWHPTAGKVYGHQPDCHRRWEALFSSNNPEFSEAYRPFSSRLEWELAQWAIKEKITQSSFNRLLRIPQIMQVKEKLGVSFLSVRSMLNKVDQIPEHSGPWYTKELAFKNRPNETFTIRHRNPLEAIKALWGDPKFSTDLVYRPAKLFRSRVQSEEERVFSEMWTTYPVYLTLGNIPKALRRKPGARACVLIAYLSVDKPFKDKQSKTLLKLRNYELFHRSMAVVLEPLKEAGNPDGSGVEMTGGDGAVRGVYPLLATYVADSDPEQCLITRTKYGTCPKCCRRANDLGLPTPGERRTQTWTTETIQSARVELQTKGERAIHSCTMKEDISGGNYDPFWVGFPLTDIHRCITPDILHQLYQGVFKHLVDWVQKIVGEEELDERIRRLPSAFGVCHFGKGISSLSQVSGTEHKQIAKILLSCLKGKMELEGIVAVRSLLHFIHLAQYSSHNQDTLQYMQQELDTWHKYRSYFIDHQVRDDFNIPKFHSLMHYVDSIRWLSTTDNYNTEAFERFHIDTAKDGWEASNKRDHFPQMVEWLSCQEKVSSYNVYRSWIDSEQHRSPLNCAENHRDSEVELSFSSHRASKKTPQGLAPQLFSLAKSPQEQGKKLTHILTSHASPLFISNLKLYLNSLLPDIQQETKAFAIQGDLPFTTVDVWHQVKLTPVKLLDEVEREIIKAMPITRKSLIARFDPVMIIDSETAESTALEG
ncbi:hypothetical protein D9757_014228 [Collybiopsis confluens]|uniref:Ubiquitin-like protease family profile domain-containing protein n=1 Tax=Collybiopsis confluens TaxID=2823264 RepID=A0A8H5G1D6_9AGAR|nr:hypothetical protein D9757_014228 [Collybiopsis confluens]